MRQGRSFRQRMPTGARTPTQRAIAVLRKYGTDAHIYLPGVGMLNGLQAGNYIDSAGTQPGEVNQPVGLVLDAGGGLGVELVTNAGIAYNASLSSGLIPSTATSNSTLSYGFFSKQLFDPGKRYQVSAAWSGNTLNRKLTFDDGQGPTNTQLQSTAQSGEITSQFTATAATFFAYASGIASVGESFTVSAISVREVTGIHAQQPTTANKSVLKLTNGRYNWLFDSTDLLTATYPAGYESVTVIDARSTGQVTTAGANIVGSYSMGPGVTLYGRMVIKGTLSASDLALLQGFANRLAAL